MMASSLSKVDWLLLVELGEGNGVSEMNKGRDFQIQQKIGHFFNFNNSRGSSGSLLVLLRSPSGAERLVFSRVF